MPPPPSPLLDEEQRQFADTVMRFASSKLRDDVTTRDAAGEFWREGWAACAELGLCGLPVPEQLGGGGADRVTTAAALEALGYGGDDTGLAFSVNAHLWSAVVPLWRFGTPDQQARYLGGLCAGRLIGVHAMTEPETGSDAFALRTTAKPSDDGFVLRGRKTLITNAPVADVLIVFARRPGSEGVLGISAFLVDAGTPGLIIERPTSKMGLRTSPMAEIALDDVRVDGSAVLGRPGRAGQIFAESMEWERLLIMASELGAIWRGIDDAVDYARSREQFGRPIASFQAVTHKIVDVVVAVEAARALLYQTAVLYDRGERSAAPAAAVKLVAAETAARAAVELLQVHGGHGYTTAFPAERRVRDAIGARLYSGTSEMMRELVARGLGLQ